MKLNVYYGNIKKTFEGDNANELLKEARRYYLYEKHSEITFEFEEVSEDGNKFREC
jgi:hypothetical protein